MVCPRGRSPLPRCQTSSPLTCRARISFLCRLTNHLEAEGVVRFHVAGRWCGATRAKGTEWCRTVPGLASRRKRAPTQRARRGCRRFASARGSNTNPGRVLWSVAGRCVQQGVEKGRLVVLGRSREQG
jgi:hypothetical protein